MVLYIPVSNLKSEVMQLSIQILTILALFLIIFYYTIRIIPKKKNDVLEVHNINNSYFKSIMENVSVIIYVKDLNCNIIKANQTLADILGCNIEDVEGKNTKDIYPQEFYESISSDDPFIKLEKQACFVDRIIAFNPAEPHWYRILKIPVLDESGDVINIIVCLKNIDSEKELEAQKSAFVATLTHDLKSPTTAQLNALNLLLRGNYGQLNPEQTEMVELTRCSCEYMLQLISIILDSYVFDNGETTLDFEEFDLKELISGIKNEINHQLQEKSQTLKITDHLSQKIILADNLQIKRVIMNLLNNAVTYGVDNSEIEIQIKSDESVIEINVINTSKIGPNENIGTVFDKFKTLNNSRYNKISTGLGLYLSKQIIELHDGEIYAEMLPDNKCMFGFKIPANIAKIKNLS